MSSSENLRRTALHAAHLALGARMVDFSGWEMPVQYSGVLAEHLAVRTAVGLFDVSHMGEVEVRGRGALQAVQRLTCNNVAALGDGQAQYTALLNRTGGVIDDLIIYRLAESRFLCVVNAGNTQVDLEWMRQEVRGAAEVVDRSDEYCLLALQGPMAAGVLSSVAEADVAALPSFGFVDTLVAGCPTVVARTGYTGEDGFEILVAEDRAAAAWNALIDGGRPVGIAPVGLGARDTLRLEAGLLLHGNDMGPETTALEAGLGFIVKWNAGDFVGRQALSDQKSAGLKRRQRGLELIDRGIARHGHKVFIDGSVCGEVTSGSFAPFLKKNIARAYVPTGHDTLGTEVEIEVRGRRLRARVVKTPFYRRSRRER